MRKVYTVEHRTEIRAYYMWLNATRSELVSNGLATVASAESNWFQAEAMELEAFWKRQDAARKGAATRSAKAKRIEEPTSRPHVAPLLN